ncbi:MAG: hypothetical protein M3520_03515 [Actinomycetota bacterium]|nr:hypothetical protein [Actinomycetota bacterium]
MTPLAPMSRAAWTRRIGSTVVVATGIGLLLWYVNSLRHGVVLSAAVVASVTAVVALLVWTTGEHGQRLQAASWFPSRREEATPPSALDYRLIRLRRDVRDTTERNDREDSIYPLIVELTQERLQYGHGIDLHDEPDRAGEVLHPDLVKYLTHPPHGIGRRSRRELHTVIQRIEEL